MRNTYCLYCSYDVLYRVPGWSVYLISQSARSGFVCVSMIWSKHIDISPYHDIFDSAAASLQKYETLALLPPPVFWQWHTAHGQCKMPTYTWTHEDSRDKVCVCCGIRTPKKKRYIVKPASTIYATFVRISLMLSYLILSH